MFVSRIQLRNIGPYPGATMDLARTITIIAGENNSGKSTLIRTLNAMQAGPPGNEVVRIGVPAGSVSVFLNDLDPALFADPNRQWVRDNQIKQAEVRYSVQVDPPSTGASIHSAPAQGSQSFQPFPSRQPRNFIVPYLSERRHTGYSANVGVQYAFSAGGSLSDVSAKVDRLLTSRDVLRAAYEDACVRVLGFLITTHPEGSGKMAGLEVDAIEQRYVPLQRLGAGVGQALGLIVELLVARQKLFLIEEPENDLHPTALRALLDLVEGSAKEGNQFVISTHSNVVLRRLGSVTGARVYQAVRRSSDALPESELKEVPNEPTARWSLLQSLGYDLSDYDLYDAWLFLEEASAESVIREFIIPWFAPRLIGRLRTLAAQGAPDIVPRFRDLHRLFVFTHLEPVYRERAWVLADGDDAGTKAVEDLRETFGTWPPQHFQCFSAPNFERYYPAEFGGRVDNVLRIPDEGIRRQQKAALARDVVEWLRVDPARGKAALEASAVEVIDQIRQIEDAVVD